MFLKHQIGILELVLKDHVTLKKIQLCHHRNKLHFKNKFKIKNNSYFCFPVLLNK